MAAGETSRLKREPTFFYNNPIYTSPSTPNASPPNPARPETPEQARRQLRPATQPAPQPNAPKTSTPTKITQSSATPSHQPSPSVGISPELKGIAHWERPSRTPDQKKSSRTSDPKKSSRTPDQKKFRERYPNIADANPWSWGEPLPAESLTELPIGPDEMAYPASRSTHISDNTLSTSTVLSDHEEAKSPRPAEASATGQPIASLSKEAAVSVSATSHPRALSRNASPTSSPLTTPGESTLTELTSKEAEGVSFCALDSVIEAQVRTFQNTPQAIEGLHTLMRPFNINLPLSGNPLLFWAIEYDNEALITWLVSQQDVNINCPNSEGKTPFQYAIEANKLSLASHFYDECLKHDYIVSFESTDSEHNSLFHSLIQCYLNTDSNEQCIAAQHFLAVIYRQAPTLLSVRNHEEETPLSALNKYLGELADSNRDSADYRKAQILRRFIEDLPTLHSSPAADVRASSQRLVSASLDDGIQELQRLLALKNAQHYWYFEANPLVPPGVWHTFLARVCNADSDFSMYTRVRQAIPELFVEGAMPATSLPINHQQLPQYAQLVETDPTTLNASELHLFIQGYPLIHLALHYHHNDFLQPLLAIDQGNLTLDCDYQGNNGAHALISACQQATDETMIVFYNQQLWELDRLTWDAEYSQSVLDYPNVNGKTPREQLQQAIKAQNPRFKVFAQLHLQQQLTHLRQDSQSTTARQVLEADVDFKLLAKARQQAQQQEQQLLQKITKTQEELRALQVELDKQQSAFSRIESEFKQAEAFTNAPPPPQPKKSWLCCFAAPPAPQPISASAALQYNLPQLTQSQNQQRKGIETLQVEQREKSTALEELQIEWQKVQEHSLTAQQEAISTLQQKITDWDKQTFMPVTLGVVESKHEGGDRPALSPIVEVEDEESVCATPTTTDSTGKPLHAANAALSTSLEAVEQATREVVTGQLFNDSDSTRSRSSSLGSVSVESTKPVEAEIQATRAQEPTPQQGVSSSTLAAVLDSDSVTAAAPATAAEPAPAPAPEPAPASLLTEEPSTVTETAALPSNTGSVTATTNTVPVGTSITASADGVAQPEASTDTLARQESQYPQFDLQATTSDSPRIADFEAVAAPDSPPAPAPESFPLVAAAGTAPIEEALPPSQEMIPPAETETQTEPGRLTTAEPTEPQTAAATPVPDMPAGVSAAMDVGVVMPDRTPTPTSEEEPVAAAASMPAQTAAPSTPTLSTGPVASPASAVEAASEAPSEPTQTTGSTVGAPAAALNQAPPLVATATSSFQPNVSMTEDLAPESTPAPSTLTLSNGPVADRTPAAEAANALLTPPVAHQPIEPAAAVIEVTASQATTTNDTRKSTSEAPSEPTQTTQATERPSNPAVVDNLIRRVIPIPSTVQAVSTRPTPAPIPVLAVTMPEAALNRAEDADPAAAAQITLAGNPSPATHSASSTRVVTVSATYNTVQAVATTSAPAAAASLTPFTDNAMAQKAEGTALAMSKPISVASRWQPAGSKTTSTPPKEPNAKPSRLAPAAAVSSPTTLTHQTESTPSPAPADTATVLRHTEKKHVNQEKKGNFEKQLKAIENNLVHNQHQSALVNAIALATELAQYKIDFTTYTYKKMLTTLGRVTTDAKDSSFAESVAQLQGLIENLTPATTSNLHK